MITRQAVSQKLQAYLNEEITLPQIVDWAENAMVDGDFEDEYVGLLAGIIGKICPMADAVIGLTTNAPMVLSCDISRW